uniref:Uncharacterized protein n=1 Tax=Suricata suricatta TaxID=37032 RepID=A0A673T4G3_SURSU
LKCRSWAGQKVVLPNGKPPTLGRSQRTWFALASSRKVRTPARVTLVALWSATVGSRESTPGYAQKQPGDLNSDSLTPRSVI